MPQFNTVRNTAILGTGRYDPTGYAIWIGNAHDNTIAANDLGYLYSGGVRVGKNLNRRNDQYSFTYNNNISFNHIWNVGQGMISDIGGVYLSSALAKNGNCPFPCNTVANNRIHDVVHNLTNGLDNIGYGGNGIYPDKGASNLLIKDNLVYRATHGCYFQNASNSGPNQQQQYPDTYDTNNHVENNVFAYCSSKKSTSGQQHVIRSGGDNPNKFIFSKNIFLLNSPIVPQANNGHWGCFADDDVTAVPCTDRFTFASNIWWNEAPGNALKFITNTDTYNSLAAWQAPRPPGAAEDAGSIAQDPKFNNPRAGDFSFKPDSPYGVIGFDAAEFAKTYSAGRTNPVLNPPLGNVPDTFPIQSLDPVADY